MSKLHIYMTTLPVFLNQVLTKNSLSLPHPPQKSVPAYSEQRTQGTSLSCVPEKLYAGKGGVSCSSEKHEL